MKLPATWTGVLFVFTLLWMLFERFIGWHSHRIEEHYLYTNIYDAVFIVILAFAMRHWRKSTDYESINWKEAWKFGLTVTGLMMLLSPLTQYIIHTWISPDFFANIKDFAVSNDLLTKESAEERFNLKTYIQQNFFGTAILGGLSSLALAFIFGRRKKLA